MPGKASERGGEGIFSKRFVHLSAQRTRLRQTQVGALGVGEFASWQIRLIDPEGDARTEP